MVDRIKGRGGRTYNQERAEAAAAEHYPEIIDDGIRRGQIYTDPSNVVAILRRWKQTQNPWKMFEFSVPQSIARYEQIIAKKAEKGGDGNLSYTNGRRTHDIYELLPFDTGIFVNFEPRIPEFTDKDGGW